MGRPMSWRKRTTKVAASMHCHSGIKIANPINNAIPSSKMNARSHIEFNFISFIVLKDLTQFPRFLLASKWFNNGIKNWQEKKNVKSEIIVKIDEYQNKINVGWLGLIFVLSWWCQIVKKIHNWLVVVLLLRKSPIFVGWCRNDGGGGGHFGLFEWIIGRGQIHGNWGGE